MPKRVLGIDIDGVLADTTSKWLQIVERRYGIKAIKKDITRHDIPEVEKFASLTEEQYIDAFKEVWSDYKNLQLEDPGIPSILDNLREKFQIYITTASVGTRSEIEAWLAKNHIVYDRLAHFSRAKDKHLLNDVDIYIDDYNKVIENLAKNGKTAILLAQPWNEHFIASNKNPKIIVAYNWREIESILVERFS